MPDQEQRPEDLCAFHFMSKRSLSLGVKFEKANVQIALITGTREQLVDKETDPRSGRD